MSYQASKSLSQSSKDIIMSITDFDEDHTGALKGELGKFHRFEILNYIKNSFSDAQKEERSSQLKVLGQISLMVEGEPENSQVLFEILEQYPTLTSQAIFSTLSDDRSFFTEPKNIRLLNELYSANHINDNLYNEKMSNIIKKHVDTKELHDAITTEITEYGTYDKASKAMVHIYMSATGLSNSKRDDILKFWSKNFNAFTKDDGYQDTLAMYFDELKPNIPVSIVDDVECFVKDVSQGKIPDCDSNIFGAGVKVLSFFYEDNPNYRTQTAPILQKLFTDDRIDDNVKEILSDDMVDPYIKKLMVDKYRRTSFLNPFYLTDLPTLAEHHPEHASSFVSLVADSLRGVGALTAESETTKIFQEAGNISNFNHKYIAFVALNDSRLPPVEALNFTRQINNKADNKSIPEYLEIFDASSILNSSKVYKSAFLAQIKYYEITGEKGSAFSKKTSQIFKRNIKNIRPDVFAANLLTYANKYEKNFTEGISLKHPYDVNTESLKSVLDVITRQTSNSPEVKNIKETLENFKADTKHYSPDTLLNLQIITNYDNSPNAQTPFMSKDRNR